MCTKYAGIFIALTFAFPLTASASDNAPAADTAAPKASSASGVGFVPGKIGKPERRVGGATRDPKRGISASEPNESVPIAASPAKKGHPAESKKTAAQ